MEKKTMIQFNKAKKEHYDVILHLLRENKLPISDLDEAKFAHFIVAEEKNTVIGCVGLEIFGSDGLLRSLSVVSSLQKKGLGSELVEKIIGYARSSGVSNVHLLTKTADKFFLKKGFIAQDRNNAPQSIQQSSEFKDECCSSAVYMTLDIGR